MARMGRYYLGRVVKLGSLESDSLLAAIAQPAVITRGRFAWTITNAMTVHEPNGERWVYGRLSKFQPEAEVAIIDRDSRTEVQRQEPDLSIASSPFVYLPESSAIAYLHIWNQIEQPTFVRRFKEIIEESFGGFFVGCEIEPVTDLERFVVRLRQMDKIDRISAKVRPPNPLFGPLWAELRRYLRDRRAREMKVEETGGPEGLRTNIVTRVAAIVDGEIPTHPDEPLPVGDAALLMATDGYGRGRVEGRRGRKSIVIRTTDKIRSFLFEKTPKPRSLFEEVRRHSRSVTDERGLEH